MTARSRGSMEHKAIRMEMEVSGVITARLTTQTVKGDEKVIALLAIPL